MAAVDVKPGFLLRRQSLQCGLDHLDRPVEKTSMETQLPKLEEHPGGLDGIAADPEEHGGAGQEVLGLLEPALILAQRALQMVDLGQRERIGDALVADEEADVLEMLVGPAQIAAGPAGVRHLGGREGEQGEGVRMIRRTLDHGAGEIGEIVSLPGVGGSPPPALLNQPLGEDRPAETAAGRAAPGETLRWRGREKLLQVPLDLPRLPQKIRRMPAEHGGERLEDVFIALLGRPLRPPRLDLAATDGAEAFEMLGLDLGETVLGQLPPSHGAEELASDVDVAQGFSSMRYRFSH